MKIADKEARDAGIPWRRWLGPAAVYALSLACLIWVYRDFDWHAELPRLKQIHWFWIVLAFSCDILVYVLQAWRWNLLLEPVAKVPLGRTVQAIYIGLFANELLPLRSGEAIRCYLQATWNRLSFAEVISSALIERLFDGVWLILGFFVSTWFVRLPGEMKYGAGIMALIVASLVVLLTFAVLRKEEAHGALERHRWLSPLRHLIHGLHVMGRSPSFWMASVVSLMYLTLQVVPLFAMIRGYGVDLNFGQATVLLVVLRLGTVIPGPPGNIGVFNAFAVLGLTLLGVERQTAVGLSGVMFFAVTVPLLLAGFLALFMTGFKIRDLQKHVRESH
ncbi:MAG: lysylphosphatidylglycerol synthase transmembrane domain-containing protein [Bryobacteraceae bacterium]|nr:lysylphosphatidylglycerol synthase transmembrane domain-containing protein [Bryobacteraceae bacterium]